MLTLFKHFGKKWLWRKFWSDGTLRVYTSDTLYRSRDNGASNSTRYMIRTLTTPVTVTTSPGTQVSQTSSNSSMSMVRGTRPPPFSFSSNSCSRTYSTIVVSSMKSVLRIHVHWSWIQPKLWIRIQAVSFAAEPREVHIFLQHLKIFPSKEVN